MAELSTMRVELAGREVRLSGEIRLLLVEDDVSIRTALAEMLSDEGYAVTAVNNGAEALDELRQGTPPDVILLDLMMPVMDGWEFRVAQRSDPMIGTIPLLAMSADLSAKAQAIAADAYVRKPIDFPDLLRQLNIVVRRATRNRLAAADRMAALGTLASGIAHEINNPLTYVIANLQTLAERLPASGDPATRELAEIVGEALDGAERIRRLVKQVQMVSPGQHQDRFSMVALRDALQTALALTENQIRHRARLICDLDQDVYVRGDRDRIEQLFVNLLLNAAQAIPEGKANQNEIRVDVRELPGQGAAIVRVEDTGVGIPVEVQERIFQPFFTTKPVGQGTGLGLSICRGIVTALGGQISFESEPAGGTTFRVVLPTTTAPA
ncbi:MAG TPA: HAMP domain-containing sensor histidine kinase [Polyangia bacterium]|nr:HAMP domain-containing sensor histidine kinase [Polyangia bacterium]